MNGSETLGHQLFVWVVIPALIFLARIGDCSIGTMRIIFIGRGHRSIAPSSASSRFSSGCSRYVRS